MLTAAMLVLILYSGLRFKWASLDNEVSWIEAQPGIRFGNSGIVYAHTTTPSAVGPKSANQAFSIELAVKPGASKDGRFRLLLLLHGGDDGTQLVVGQWRSWLVIMNGDDYDAKRRRPRIAVEALLPQKERFITITSDGNGTALFLDGRLAKKSAGLSLGIPNKGRELRLVLGNSVYGRHPWVGDILGLAFFDRALTAPSVEDHFQQWGRTQSFAWAQSQNAAGLYLFDEGRGAKVVDHAAGGNDLQVPEKMTILTKEFLAAPFTGEEYNLTLSQDMVINTVGFVPMGFLLSALLWHGHCRNVRKQLLLVLLVCGAVSLTIEIVQAWIPSRSSQMLDLILNTLGAGLGVGLHSLYQRIFPKPQPRRSL